MLLFTLRKLIHTVSQLVIDEDLLCLLLPGCHVSLKTHTVPKCEVRVKSVFRPCLPGLIRVWVWGDNRILTI